MAWWPGGSLGQRRVGGGFPVDNRLNTTVGATNPLLAICPWQNRTALSTFIHARTCPVSTLGFAARSGRRWALLRSAQPLNEGEDRLPGCQASVATLAQGNHHGGNSNNMDSGVSSLT